VVAAIFSLNLEAGMLFICYFLLAGITLALQLFYKNNHDIAQLNRISSKLAMDQLSGRPTSSSVLTFFDSELRSGKSFRQLIKHLTLWFIITIAFTMVMFYMIPRQTQPWLGGAQVEITAVSPSKSVDLLNRGQIQLSNQILFRAHFERLNGMGVFSPPEPPYFRGIALSSLVIQDGQTNWRAPNDRVFPDAYQDLMPIAEGRNRIKQVITAEENRHPIVYSNMPVFAYSLLTTPIEYCHEIAALTRCKLNAPLELAPFKYELLTIVDQNGAWFETWPYLTNHSAFGSFPMAVDPAEREWLTQHHPERYPTIVNTGQQIVDDLKAEGKVPTQRDICKAMEAYFLEPRRFVYTLDYRNVKRNEQLDPNEDFVRNHRAGHCEMFASALTLMLRSQDIPARLVTGFHGGDSTQLSGGLTVRARHAHAWVEAYLPPEECSEEMIRNGSASRGGAWLRLDPTPPTASSTGVGVGTEAIDFARSFWQDYILGMNAELTQTDSDLANSKLIQFFQAIQWDGWERAIFKFDATVKSRSFRYLLAALVVLPPLLTWLFTAFLKFRTTSNSKSTHSGLRRWLASAISLISPSLGKWMLAGRNNQSDDIRFYHRLITILKDQGLERAPHQSQRDFSKVVGHQFRHHPQSQLISSVVYEVSEIFNEVRFGKQSLPTDLREQIDECLNELETGLKMS
jgi:transglutaminase-like putative cysteine protease